MKYLLTLLSAAFLLAACEKYKDYENLEVIENNFTGTILVSESVGDVDGEFMGSVDSGVYGFIWENPTKGALLYVDALVDTGSVRFIVEDSRGDEVLNASVTGTESSFSINGKKGNWKIRVSFSDFGGEGSFDLNPVQ